MNPILTKTYVTQAAVAPRRILKWGTLDNTVIQGAAATDLLIGVSDSYGAASGDPCEVYRTGIVEIDCGGTVTRGNPLTADANGKAVVAAPAAGANVRLIGIAEVSGVAGDIIDVRLALSYMQG